MSDSYEAYCKERKKLTLNYCIVIFAILLTDLFNKIFICIFMIVCISVIFLVGIETYVFEWLFDIML